MKLEKGRVHMGQDEQGNKIPLPLDFVLKEHFTEIYEEMNNNEYYPLINDSEYPVIKEIKVNGNTVGFSTYRFNPDQNLGILVIAYILEKFRGNGLLIQDIEDTEKLFKCTVGIEDPNQYVIISLLNHGKAMRIGNNLVLSNIPLSIPVGNFNDKNNDPVFGSIISNIYDTYISRIITTFNDKFVISDLLDVDMRDFNALINNMDLDECYLSNQMRHVKKYLKSQQGFEV